MEKRKEKLYFKNLDEKFSPQIHTKEVLLIFLIFLNNKQINLKSNENL